MDLLNGTVTIFEENRTRAELYQLWLDEFDVRIAVTKTEAADVLDGTSAVAVIGREFGGGDGPKLLELVRKRTPHCRVAVTRERSSGFPGVDPEYHLVAPVFEDELREVVGRLVGQANYRIALVEYYRASSELASLEFAAERADEGDDPDDDRATRLEQRIDRLKHLLARYRRALDSEDIATVMESISFGTPSAEAESEPQSSSKYHPDHCTNCGRDWDVSKGSAESAGFSQLGAYVWRCADCGQVHMQPDPSHQRVSPYEW